MNDQIESYDTIFLVSLGNNRCIHIFGYHTLMSFSDLDTALDYAVKYIQSCSIHKLNASYIRQQFIQSCDTSATIFGIKRYSFEYDSTSQPDNIIVIDEIPFKS